MSIEKKSLWTVLAIVVAYLFSYLLHLYWIGWASHNPEFFWNGQLMINNVDGYFFGSGAQKILYHLHLDNPRLLDIWRYGTAVLTAYIVKLLPISLDTAMLYLPPVISSLVVIPVILIGRLYGNLLWGFLSALIASIGWSYYNRTLAGYYDTDMFSAMLPMFILFFLLAAVKYRSLNYILAASLTVILYPWLYDQGLSIVYAMGIMMFLYLVILYRNEKFSYQAIIIFSFALMPIFWVLKLFLVLILWYLLKTYDTELRKLQIAAGVSVLAFLLLGNVFGIILHKVFSYTSKTEQISGLHFLNVNETVREAGKIPFEVVADRIVGSLLGLVIAVVGYILLLVRNKEFIIALPLWGIGFFAYFGGLRFTVYAVPIAAMSAVYFFFWLSERFEARKIRMAIVSLGTLFVLTPNITHITGCCEKISWLDGIKGFYPLKSYPYLTPTTLLKSEVALLDELNKKSSPKDYAITWWDYGYPIWYYGDVNTLIDGGKHNEDNFLVSKILSTSNQRLAANLAKLSIKVYTDTNKTVAPQLFIKKGKTINVDKFFTKISSKEYKSPKLNRNIYLILPHRMFNIFPTVTYFSQRNLNTGEVYRREFYYKNRIMQKGNKLYIGQLIVDLQRATVLIGNQQVPIKSVYIVGIDRSGKSHYKEQKIRDKGINLIINKSFGEALLADDMYLHSTFFQMYLFDKYDPELFEPVIISPWMKIYRIK
ncbi:dolichyl-diphosphooligosaccharide---protein glycosyltransferase [Nitratiruptor sp. YY08-26]|uniref:STT3 domain-containing protein n=1 Tax=unclassified Nitratiruptor TaxID=2624044 RepID=UPI0019161B20|nr:MULTISPECIES: STT3 domain-containing protein [unclassified Nitratiruptor]BCD62557.1 dolichyl-diphosphooligosaccharide---protein glycosyltransferase [Nitratiruptor sp. YY08-13]BCD66493.1 dolichyl-diphosphooligosaccharide---protein glycosyltransferase [Nitratiruptor sp. YY08-26]